MKALYITSVETSSGKTAVCLAIGKRFQAEGHKVGYMKPVSRQPIQLKGHVADEDTAFVKNVLALAQEAWELSPVVITPQTLADCLGGDDPCGFGNKIQEACAKAAEGKDVLLLEGGGNLCEGFAIGLPTSHVAETLEASALLVARYQGRMRLLDDALSAQFLLGERLLGLLVNRVPEQAMDFVREQATPFLEEQGIPVLGVLPERSHLAAISVGELIETLDAKVLAGESQKDALIESLVVGAMGGQEALSRLRVYQNKVVITGGDRTDIQLAALETVTIAMILTGNLRPAASIVQRAEEQGVAILLVPTNTLETVEAIERVFGKTRLGQAEKLVHFESLMAEHVNYKRLSELLGV